MCFTLHFHTHNNNNNQIVVILVSLSGKYLALCSSLVLVKQNICIISWYQLFYLYYYLVILIWSILLMCHMSGNSLYTDHDCMKLLTQLFLACPEQEICDNFILGEMAFQVNLMPRPCQESGWFNFTTSGWNE